MKICTLDRFNTAIQSFFLKVKIPLTYREGVIIVVKLGVVVVKPCSWNLFSVRNFIQYKIVWLAFSYKYALTKKEPNLGRSGSFTRTLYENENL